MNMFSPRRQGSRSLNRPRFRRALSAALLCAAVLPVQAAGIRVAESFGFSFALGPTWSIDASASPVVYEQFDGSGNARFGMSFDGAVFHLTALNDNALSSMPSTPWGFCLFPLLGSMIPPGYEGSTSLGFIPWFDFPSVAGDCVDVAVPTPLPVPEPGAVALVLAGCCVLAGLSGRPIGRPSDRTRAAA